MPAGTPLPTLVISKVKRSVDFGIGRFKPRIFVGGNYKFYG